MDKSDGDVVGVTEILQFRSKVDITRYEDHSTRRVVGVGKSPQALPKFVICSILGHSTDVDQSDLIGNMVQCNAVNLFIYTHAH